jgi:HEPN domain-containing protein
MPPENLRLSEAKPWFTKAAQDLRAAEVLMSANPPLPGEAAYHCQQAAEKALKGYLAWHDVPFGKTHDLAAIGTLCASREPDLESLCRRADRLTVFAWAFRYPGDPEDPTQEDVEEAIGLAREVFETMLSRLPAELRP